MSGARIGFLGAFSIDNAGDALVGYAGRQALRALVPDATHVVLAPALPEALWQHAWDRERGIDAEIVAIPADDSVAWAEGLDAVVIGGGGIIHLAPAFRPFLLGTAARWDPARPAAWNAVCSQNQPWYAGAHRDAYDAIRACCETLRYVAVRNRTTLALVRHCGFLGEVHVVPDPALALDVPAAIDDRVTELLRELGARDDRLLVGVSLGPAARDARTTLFYRELFGALDAIARAVPLQLVVFPFSNIQGDAAIAADVARQFDDAILVRARLSPFELWRLIGRMGAYIGSRYHAMLAAFAQNVPFVVLDEYLSDAMASSKTREFVADLGLEPHYLCPYLPSSPGWKLEQLIFGREQVTFANRLAEARARIAAHYNQMVSALDLV